MALEKRKLYLVQMLYDLMGPHKKTGILAKYTYDS